MKAYNPKLWKEKTDLRILETKYGENARLIKRFEKKVRKTSTE